MTFQLDSSVKSNMSCEEADAWFAQHFLIISDRFIDVFGLFEHKEVPKNAKLTRFVNLEVVRIPASCCHKCRFDMI